MTTTQRKRTVALDDLAELSDEVRDALRRAAPGCLVYVPSGRPGKAAERRERVLMLDRMRQAGEPWSVSRIAREVDITERAAGRIIQKARQARATSEASDGG